MLKNMNFLGIGCLVGIDASHHGQMFVGLLGGVVLELPLPVDLADDSTSSCT
jgi:hypothetical protein